MSFRKTYEAKTKQLSVAIALTSVTAALLLSGCGVSPVIAMSSNQAISLSIQGTLFGGRQPISGATVTLYAFGATGYGSAATPRGSVATGSNGAFTFTTGVNTCTASDVLYIVATGGNPGSGVVNPATTLMSVLGTCATSKTAIVNIDEISTVASMYSLAQFFNPQTESFGHSAASSTGLTNSIATVSVLADLAHGLANTSTTTGSTNVITLTPESQKINLIANMLAACVNSNQSASVTSTQCSELFSNAVPPPNGAVTSLGAGATFPAATDVLMAAYYLAVNPVNASTLGTPSPTRASALMGIAVANSPYQPSLSSTPNDWTIAISYTANFSAGTTPNVYYPFSATTNPMLDSLGDLFYVNLPGTNDSRTKIFANGTFASAGPTSPSTLSPLAAASTMDSNDNTYYGPTVSKSGAGTGNGLYESPSANNFSPTYSGNLEHYAGFAADGTTNVISSKQFAQIVMTDAVNGNLYVLPSSTSSTVTTPLTLLATSLSLTGAGPYGVALDQTGYAWVAETGGNAIDKITYNSVTTPARITSSSAFRNPVAVAVDHSNNVWIANGVGTTDNGFLSYVSAAGTVTATDTVGDDGINNPVEEAVDGAGNVWVASAGQTVNAVPNVGQTVSELSYVGSAIKPLSPSAGYTHNYNGVSGIAIDGSGNVWVTNSAAIASSTTSGLITEIVGAAVPVVTPLALGIKNSTLATKP